MPRVRLDCFLVDNGLTPTRTKAQALIRAGRVRIRGNLADKPGTLIDSGETVTVLPPAKAFVSRAGEKLQGALEAFGIIVDGRRALDLGASTGGFTDCLLQAGATHVIAVDVGKGLLDWKLRNDARVILMEGVNARYLQPEQLPFLPDLVTADLSFIGVEKVLEPVVKWLSAGTDLIILFKPQFEVGRKRVGKGGIVREERFREEALTAFQQWCAGQGIQWLGAVASPVKGAKGNQEYLVWLRLTEVRKGVEISSMAGQDSFHHQTKGEVMADCLFCKIIEGAIPSRRAYEDERFVAFYDINPAAPTHILVIPRKHISTLHDLQPEDYPLMGELLGVTQRIAGEHGLEEGGYRVVNNCGAGAGQSVFHIHFHLLGGRPMAWPPG